MSRWRARLTAVAGGGPARLSAAADGPRARDHRPVHPVRPVTARRRARGAGARRGPLTAERRGPGRTRVPRAPDRPVPVWSRGPYGRRPARVPSTGRWAVPTLGAGAPGGPYAAACKTWSMSSTRRCPARGHGHLSSHVAATHPDHHVAPSRSSGHHPSLVAYGAQLRTEVRLLRAHGVPQPPSPGPTAGGLLTTVPVTWSIARTRENHPGHPANRL